MTNYRNIIAFLSLFFFFDFYIGRIENGGTCDKNFTNSLFIHYACQLTRYYDVSPTFLSIYLAYLLIDRRIRISYGFNEHQQRNTKKFIEKIKTSYRIKLLDLWTDITDNNHKEALKNAISGSINKIECIHILVGNPDSKSIEQRDIDLPDEEVEKKHVWEPITFIPYENLLKLAIKSTSTNSK